MTEPRRVVIRRLASGVPGLDEVFGGGIAEYSFNLIAGAPDTGKTTLAQQIMFTNATRDRPGLYFTVLGEPAIKMLRYQQQFHFFDPARVGDDVQYINLTEEVLHESLDATLGRITREIERVSPSIVVVDSFRTILQPTDSSLFRELELQHFVQRLVFEEHPQAFIERAGSLGFDVQAMVDAGKLDIMYLRPLDLSVDETLQEITERVRRLDAKRLVIDSLTGFEAAVAPTFRQDFRESFYRLMVSLTALGVTIVSIVEIVETSDYLRFSPYNISFMTDDIVAMRFVELEGELRKVLAVIKMRGSDHSRELRAYRVTSRGLETGEALRDYRGIITGVPERRSGPRDVGRVELTTTEAIVLDVLLRLGETSTETIANDTGLTLEQVREALDRLLEVACARSVDRGEETRYRAAPKGLA